LDFPSPVRAGAREGSRQIIDSIDQALGTFWGTTAETADEPITRGIARGNLELVRLVRRRAEAYADLPSRFAQCRAPQDLINEQARFFATMVSDYQSSTERLVENWSMTASSLAASFMTGIGDDARPISRH
jgi:hypothetical protein